MLGCMIEMCYNERLMNESLKGDDEALKELKLYAGSGDCEAQYFIALYYARSCGHLHDPDYHYWQEKSKENGYEPGVGNTNNYYGMEPRIGLQLTWNEINVFSHLLSLLSLL